MAFFFSLRALVGMCFVKRMCAGSNLVTAEPRESAECLLIGSGLPSPTYYAGRREAGEGVSTGSYCFHCKQRIFFPSPFPDTV